MVVTYMHICIEFSVLEVLDLGIFSIQCAEIVLLWHVVLTYSVSVSLFARCHEKSPVWHPRDARCQNPNPIEQAVESVH